MKKYIITAIIGLALLLGGAGILIAIIRSMRSNIVSAPSVSVQTHIAAAQPATSSSAPQKLEGNPVKIDIPSLNISLPIIPGTYNAKTGTWTLTRDKVQYATITPRPNNVEGNTFIYGHYRKNVFASLHTIPSDGVAVVTTDNGHTFYYRLNAVRTVKPTDSQGIFDYQGKPILTIQTCTGLLYEKRQLFTFDLVRVG